MPKTSLFVEKKNYINSIWVQRWITEQLPVKVALCQIAKYGLVLKGAKSSRGQEVNVGKKLKNVIVHWKIYTTIIGPSNDSLKESFDFC